MDVVEVKETMGEKLHVICASHIGVEGGPARLSMLRDMVGSWRSQTVRCLLTVSMSCDARVAPLVAHVVEQLRRSSPGLAITVREGERLSQFQHYRLILRSFADVNGGGSEGLWVLFTDDDDVWHPRRVEHYLGVVLWLGEHGELDRVLAVRSRAVLIGPFEGIDVEGALLSGRVKRDDIGQEHWMFCCRATTLKDFVERADEQLIADKFCDMYLIKYLAYSEGNKCADMAETGAKEWDGALYAYRHGSKRHGAGLCGGDAVSQVEAVRHMVVLAYSEMLRRSTPDMLARKVSAYVKETYGVMASDAVLRACRRLARSGAVDAFIHSPMP